MHITWLKHITQILKYHFLFLQAKSFNFIMWSQFAQIICMVCLFWTDFIPGFGMVCIYFKIIYLWYVYFSHSPLTYHNMVGFFYFRRRDLFPSFQTDTKGEPLAWLALALTVKVWLENRGCFSEDTPSPISFSFFS